MSVATPSESRVVLPHVDWAIFEALANSDLAGTRLTYDRGRLEIISPSTEHEWYHKLLGQLVEAFTEVRRIPRRSGGSTTLQDELLDRGVEPDECYYIAHEPDVRGRHNFDLQTAPPPDLAIEVELSHAAIDKLPIYAALGVGEIWRYVDGVVRILCLSPDGTYVSVEHSRALSPLRAADLTAWLDRADALDETSWIMEFREWVRTLP